MFAGCDQVGDRPRSLHVQLSALPGSGRNLLFLYGEPAQRDRSLLVEHIEHLRCAFSAARAERPFETIAAVVLPDHLHCVWRLPEGDADYATRWRHIKSLFSRSLVVTGSASRRANRCERGIWQRRFWEHCIRDERDLLAHIEYVHFNPVKHGYVDDTREWPYSTIHRYIGLNKRPAG